MTPDEIIETLGLEFDFDINKFNQDDEKLHQIRRRIRNYAYKVQAGTLELVPVRFIEFFESKPDFIKWEHFANIWDVAQDNPTEIIRRTASVHQEWDNVLRRVVPELPSDMVKVQPS